MAITSRTVWRSLRWYVVFIHVLLLIYTSSYAILYRRGAAEASQYRFDFIFYAPIEDVLQDRSGTGQHYYLGLIYDPINHLYHRWFGGRWACRGMTRGLSL